MRIVLQRVSRAQVTVDEEIVGRIDRGVLALVGIEDGDAREDLEAAAKKMAGLRLFEDADSKTNLDTAAVGGSFLVVSQFTLAADVAKGRRPSYNRAARPETARPMVEELMEMLRAEGFRVEGGRFQAHMKVELINDGPVTLVLDVLGGKVQRR